MALSIGLAVMLWRVNGVDLGREHLK